MNAHGDVSCFWSHHLKVKNKLIIYEVKTTSKQSVKNTLRMVSSVQINNKSRLTVVYDNCYFVLLKNSFLSLKLHNPQNASPHDRMADMLSMSA